MPNTPEEKKYPDLPQNIGTIHTENLDLATLLNVMVAGKVFELYQVSRTRGIPQKAVWFFADTPVSQEITKLWLKCNNPENNRRWETFTDNEKEAAIHLLAGFCNERKSTLRQAKEVMAL